MVTLYPDLVAEMTEGNVQLAISQDYLPIVFYESSAFKLLC